MLLACHMYVVYFKLDAFFYNYDLLLHFLYYLVLKKHAIESSIDSMKEE